MRPDRLRSSPAMPAGTELTSKAKLVFLLILDSILVHSGLSALSYPAKTAEQDFGAIAGSDKRLVLGSEVGSGARGNK